MEEQHPLLPSKAMRRRSSRGFLSKVRVRLARIIKAFGRSASRLRHSKPSCRLAVCMQKASHQLRTKMKGRPYANSGIFFHTRSVNGHRSLFNSPHHVNNPLQSPLTHRSYDDEEHALESLALLHLQSSDKYADISATPHMNPRLHQKKSFFTSNHMVLSCNPKKYAHVSFGSFDERLKLRIRRWQRRMNRTITSMGPHRTNVPHDVPKGCVGIYIGTEQARFVVPIPHLNHPLFANLLECMHENYEFSQLGPLWIPCDVAEFETLHSQVKQLSKKRHHGSNFNKDIF